MAGGGKGQAPQTVAEGLGDVLNGIIRCQQAPDAVHFAGPLLKLQMQVLDLVHGQMNQGQGGGQGGPPGGGPGGPPGGAPPGAGGPPSPLMGGIAGMQGGAPQGPSAATSGAGPTPSGMDPEQLRQMALLGGNQ
jgi:hypothetical protein